MAVLILSFGCASDNLEEFYGEDDVCNEGVSFMGDIKPIIETNCLLSGCHGDNSALPDWGDFSVFQANAQKVKTRTSNGTMPPSGSGRSLTEEQVQKIACWADNGALNN